METRTLLVGLGGTGCEIVDRVAGMIKANIVPEQHIRCVGFDTATTDISKMKNIPIIQTSKNQNVGSYLDNEDGWQTWFPNSPLLMARNMLDGAGQIRPLSRLAFLETIRSGRMNTLISAIKELNVEMGNVNPSNMRVMLVSSLAGGTGSGMFLHAATYLRTYFKETYNTDILLRGLFAFPDIYMATTDNEVEKESKYANAYAALRELNAMNRVTLGQSDKINMEFDGWFNSLNNHGQDLAFQKPFNMMFFIDNLNQKGNTLPTLDHYKELMANITYMQIYSPLCEQQYSQEDNQFLTVIMANGEAIYGSSGFAALEYPYEDIVKYCGLCAVRDSIDQDWTFFDTQWEKASKANDLQRKANPHVKKIKRDDSYIHDVEEGFANERFRFILDETQIEDIQTGITRKRDDIYYDYSIKDIILKKSDNNDKLNDFQKNCAVNRPVIDDPTEIANEVARVENALKLYQAEIEAFVQMTSPGLVQSIIADDLKEISYYDNGEYSISTLLKKQDSDKMVHPLSARLLLYRLRNRILADIDSSIKQVRECQESSKAFKEYDYNSSEPGTQGAIITATVLGGSSFVKRFSPALNRFKTSYVREANNQLGNLDHYRYVLLLLNVLTGVRNRIDFLIAKYELFFDCLPRIKKNISVEIESLANAHSGEAELVLYIKSSPQWKKKIYNELHVVTDNENNDEVCRAIFESMYQEACLELNSQLKIRYQNETDTERDNRTLQTMETIFRDSVVNHTIKAIEKDKRDFLNINIFDALQQHCEESSLNPHDILAKVEAKGTPFLSHNENHFANSMKFWGLNPETKKKISESDAKFRTSVEQYFVVGTSETAPYISESPRYSRFSIKFYQSVYGIKMNDIKKFSETGDFGVFYKNYQSRITEMVKRENFALTPHLDIRWHQTNYIPYINQAKNDEDDIQAARNLWLALAYDGIYVDDKNRFVSTILNGDQILMDDGKEVTPNEVHKLFILLKNNLRMNLKIEEELKNKYIRELNNTRSGNIDDKSFVMRLISEDVPEQNAANLIYHLGEEPGGAPELEIVFKALEDLITSFCSKAFAEEADRQQLIKSIKKRIIDNSVICNLDRRSSQFRRFQDWV